MQGISRILVMSIKMRNLAPTTGERPLMRFEGWDAMVCCCVKVMVNSFGLVTVTVMGPFPIPSGVSSVQLITCRPV